MYNIYQQSLVSQLNCLRFHLSGLVRQRSAYSGARGSTYLSKLRVSCVTCRVSEWPTEITFWRCRPSAVVILADAESYKPDRPTEANNGARHDADSCGASTRTLPTTAHRHSPRQHTDTPRDSTPTLPATAHRHSPRQHTDITGHPHRDNFRGPRTDIPWCQTCTFPTSAHGHSSVLFHGYSSVSLRGLSPASAHRHSSATAAGHSAALGREHCSAAARVFLRRLQHSLITAQRHSPASGHGHSPATSGHLPASVHKHSQYLGRNHLGYLLQLVDKCITTYFCPFGWMCAYGGRFFNF